MTPMLATLIADVTIARAAADEHARNVLGPLEEAGGPSEHLATEIRRNNDLCHRWCEVEHSVAGYPARTVTDLHAKLAFMVERDMGNGMDWLPELLADATRLVGVSSVGDCTPFRKAQATYLASVTRLNGLRGLSKEDFAAEEAAFLDSATALHAAPAADFREFAESFLEGCDKGDSYFAESTFGRLVADAIRLTGEV